MSPPVSLGQRYAPQGWDRAACGRLALDLSRLGLALFVVLLPFGVTFREIFGSLATCGVLAYYACDWPSANLRRIPLRWVLAAFYLLVALKTFHSIAPHTSRYILSHCWYNSLLLPLAAVEFVRRPRHLALLLTLFVTMAGLEGLTGVWQYVAGRHPFNGEPLWGGLRVTGSLGGSGRVGNLMGLALPMLVGMPAALALLRSADRAAWSPGRRWALSAGLGASILWLLVKANARSGIFGGALGLATALCLRWRRRGLLLALALATGVVVLGSQSLNAYHFQREARWEIWSVALDVFAARPLLGTGIGGFNTGFRELGVVLQKAEDDLPHPHNAYLQFLAETGLVGTAVFLALLWGSLYWSWRRLRPVLAAGGYEASLAAASLGAVVAYIVTCAGAHDFFRPWWLGAAMVVLGMALGAATILPQPPGDEP